MNSGCLPSEWSEQVTVGGEGGKWCQDLWPQLLPPTSCPSGSRNAGKRRRHWRLGLGLPGDLQGRESGMRRGDASRTDANGGRASEIPAERGPLVFLSGNMGRRSLSRYCGRRAGGSPSRHSRHERISGGSWGKVRVQASPPLLPLPEIKESMNCSVCTFGACSELNQSSCLRQVFGLTRLCEPRVWGKSLISCFMKNHSFVHLVHRFSKMNVRHLL